jgi:GDP-L-fucose synthase
LRGRVHEEQAIIDARGVEMIEGYFKDKALLVTGGAGFLGKFVVEELRRRGARKILTPRSREYDLTEERQVKRLFEEAGPIDVVIHLAAVAGGIGFNREHPAEVFYGNIMMNTLVMEYARQNGVEKFVGIGSVCEYPKFAPVPFRETSLWEGYPEETNAPYGLAKKMMLVQG